MVVVVVQIAALLAIFYFLLIRPQRQQAKQHETMLKGIKKGDEIVTTGGIVGRVVHVKDDRMTIESGESRLVIERERIAKVLTAPSTAEPAAK
jgi:preprotein translocase subunit YajC